MTLVLDDLDRRANATHDQSVLAMITSAGGEWPSDVTIQGWREAGLSVPCKDPLKLFTLDDALILRKAGALPERDAEAVKRSLACFPAMDTDVAPRTLESPWACSRPPSSARAGAPFLVERARTP